MTSDQYGSNTYGDRIADVYDERIVVDPADAARTLAELAGSGAVLELGIGTGRVALPLRELGVDIRGIDASERMIERLREKAGGADISVTIGDFEAVDVEGTFAIVFADVSTFFVLKTQEAQVTCFRNVARRLAEDGLFVIEAFVPDPAILDRGQEITIRQLDMDAIHIEASRHDLSTQRISSRQVVLGEQGVRVYPTEIRFAWPSELDLMARLAGLRLRDRWSDWQRGVFTSESSRHVSVYARE